MCNNAGKYGKYNEMLCFKFPFLQSRGFSKGAIKSKASYKLYIKKLIRNK